MRVRIWVVAAVFGSLFVSIVGASEPDGTSPDRHMERQTRNAAGDPRRPVILKVDVLKPPGPGPFPLAIFNHGSRDSTTSKTSAQGMTLSFNMGIYYFLSRGYAVLQTHLRGYEGSGGTLPNTGCALDDLGRANAKDILASLSTVADDPRIDTTRIVVAGESLGGWNTLALGAGGDPRVKALVNFYGGARSSACKHGDRALIDGARAFGKDTRIPSLWIYGDNDRYFARPLWMAMHRAYAAGAKDAELFGYGKFGSDSHRLLGQRYALGLYAPTVDTFLKRLGLPIAVTHPEFIPMTPPPPSGYARIDDVAAVPFLNDAQREAYRTFLKKPTPKIFLIAEGKGALWSAEGFDPFASGLASCRQKGFTCRPYAFDNDVVWTYPKPQPPATSFAAVDDVAAVPYLDEAGRNGYRAFLKLGKPRAFAVAPNGYWSAATGTLDPAGEALALCERQKQSCLPYAVDARVVWPVERSAAPR